MQRVNDHEWILSLTDRMDKPDITLMLTVPDEHIAKALAAQWAISGEALHQQLLIRLSPEHRE